VASTEVATLPRPAFRGQGSEPRIPRVELAIGGNSFSGQKGACITRQRLKDLRPSARALDGANETPLEVVLIHEIEEIWRGLPILDHVRNLKGSPEALKRKKRVDVAFHQTDVGTYVPHLRLELFCFAKGPI